MITLPYRFSGSFLLACAAIATAAALLQTQAGAQQTTPRSAADIQAGTAMPTMYDGYTQTRGGEGGRVIRVTNLNAAGPGSLKEALEAKGPRIVVFEVGGIIDLKGQTLIVREPFLTIAGQTAPSPGITLIDGMLAIRKTHDVIVSHMRFRPGDGLKQEGRKEKDGLTTDGSRDVIVDHCSFSWGTDENLSASGPATPDGASSRITFSNNIIAESLNDSLHTKGEHSMGTLIHDHTRDFAILGNFYAHNRQRNPLVMTSSTGVIVNNLIYNPRHTAIHLARVDRKNGVAQENCRVAVIGNVLRHGTDTVENLSLVIVPMHHRGSAYLADNLVWRPDNSAGVPWWGNLTVLDEIPTWPDALRPVTAASTEQNVLRNAGARPNDRDSVDQRILNDYRNRKGRIIDSQEEVGGYPVANEVRIKLDVPETGVTEWLQAQAEQLMNR